MAFALEAIPRTLSANCGVDVIRVITDLRSKHAVQDHKGLMFGIDGNKGVIANMEEIGVWECSAVKS